MTVGNDISGSGQLIQQGTGVVTLNGTSTYTGSMEVASGTLAVGSNGAVGETSQITVDDDASLDVQANLGSIPITVSGSGVSGAGVLVTSTGQGTIGGMVTLNSNISVGERARSTSPAYSRTRRTPALG